MNSSSKSKRGRKPKAPATHTRSTVNPSADPTTAWAKDVVAGRIVSGDFMRRACERHLRDIVDGPRRGLHWRPEIAARPMRFFPGVLTVTAGAKVGQPFELVSYTQFVVGSLFGWCRSSGLRRFRHAWIETGKGQIKSPLMAAIGLYVLGYDGIARSEVYALAKDRQQANVLFGDAARMAEAPIVGSDPEAPESLVSRGDIVVRGTGEMAWMLEHPASSSKFRSLAGDEVVNGPRPSLILGDEVHEWKSAAQIETWQSAIAKMPGNSLMILGTNTPAADQLVGTEYSEIYQSILRGEADDDTAFAFIARVDEKDDPMIDESVWPKSLPCLDITFPRENVRGEVQASAKRIAKAMSTKRLYFGIPTGASEYWIDLDAWESVQGKVNAHAMRGRSCILSLDLSQKNDLTALGAGWLDDAARLQALVRYWRPAGNMADAERADKAPYSQWATAHQMTPVPGLSIDYEFVAAEVQRWCAEHDVACLVFDPAHASEFRKAADRIGLKTWIWTPDEPFGDGLKMVIHGQGRMGMQSQKALWMPRSLGQLEDRILANRIVIDESPVTRWCAGNAAVQADAQNNRYLVKKRSRGRIDGLVALAMLAGAFDTEHATFSAGGGSIFDRPELWD